MNKHKLMGAFAAAFILALPQAAMAEGFYVDIGVGQAKADLDTPSGWNDDDTDTAYSVGVGYKFNNYIAIEGGYLDLGEASQTGTGTVSGTLYGSPFSATGTFTGTYEVDGFYLGPVLRLPVADRLELNARAGVYFWGLDVKASATGTLTYAGTIYAGGVTATGSDDGEDFYFGIGATYNATKSIAVGADWTRYDIDGTDVDVLSARLKYNF